MIDVSEIMDDPDFATTFTIWRNDGYFKDGRWINTTPCEVPNVTGIIQPASTEDQLSILPEGSRLGNMIVIWSSAEIRIDDADKTRSDIIDWKGDKYRVLRIKKRDDNGFFHAWAEGFIE